MSGMFTKKHLEEGMWLFFQIFDPGNNLILPRAQINSFVIPAQAGIHSAVNAEISVTTG